MERDTGSPRADAEADFLRARRHQSLAALAARLRGEGATGSQALAFDEVADALGRLGEHGEGLQMVPVGAIIGSVDKSRDFDPAMRPRSGRSRQRFERLAVAARRGESFPPIDVYRIGPAERGVYFVRDGHHRVAVARSLGLRVIEADVVAVRTRVRLEEISDDTDPSGIRLDDVNRGELIRILAERVPLPPLERTAVRMADVGRYPELAELVEAWAARRMFRTGELLGREEAALAWFTEEFEPVTERLREAGLVGRREAPADAYLRLSQERYATFREHVWNQEVIDALRRRRRP